MTWLDIVFGDGVSISVDLSEDVLQYNVTGLRPYRLYEIYAQAKTERENGLELWGPASDIILSRTLPSSLFSQLNLLRICCL